MSNTPSILIVEDDKDACHILCNAVRRRFSDLTTYCAENGREGLELFKEYHPDIVVTDINMPEMDGLDMAGAIRTIAPNAKFIVVTAFSGKGYMDRFSEIGFSHYIVKPLEFGKIFAAIEGCLKELKR